MKAKLKGANGFVRFLLNHGEKIGIAAILAVAGMLIWSSLGRPVVEEAKQPESLKRAATDADSHVKTMSWDGFPPDKRTDWSAFNARPGERVMAPVNPDQYPQLSNQIDPPAIDPVKLRQDPVLVAAADLEVRPGAGLWMDGDPEVIRQKMLAAAKEAGRERKEAEDEAARMAEDAEGEGRGRGRGPGGPRGGFGEGRGGYGGMGDGGMKTKDGALVVPPRGGVQMQGFEDIREEAWVTVLAKVPIKQQYQMYEDALATARGFNMTTDQPKYIGYVVERAEVTEEGTGKYVALPAVKGSEIIKKMSRWPIQTPDLVNPKYIHPLLTHPLPPMVMREWGDEITHSDLPLPTPEDLMGGPEMEGMETPQPEAEADPDDPFGSAARRQTPAGSMMGRGGEMGMGRPSMGRGGEMGMGRPSIGMGRPSMGRGGEMGMGRPSMGMGGMGSDASMELPEYAWDGLTKSVLFRFFDDTVQPGHRYRYRVALVLQDVNADQLAKFLDPTVSARQAKEKRRWRMTDWSEPSPVAVVPQPGLVFVAQTKDVAGPEPEARVIVKSVDSVNAAEIAMNNWFTRGSVLNFSQQAQIIWSSLYEVDPEEPADSPVFNFLTGLTLVDVDGGDQLTKNRNLMAPARALVMDSSGRLMMQNELSDGKTIREFDFIMRQSAEAERRAREGESERGPGGRGGRGRGRGGF